MADRDMEKEFIRVLSEGADAICDSLVSALARNVAESVIEVSEEKMTDPVLAPRKELFLMKVCDHIQKYVEKSHGEVKVSDE